MERDDHRTFGDIHGTQEQLATAVEEIIDLAVVKVSESEPLKLRFLTPLHLTGNWRSEAACQDFKLTSPNDHTPAMQYVTVSYCWQNEQSTNGLPPVPDYRIWDSTSSEGKSRAVRCPELVFHRAWRFAQVANHPYLWIDQECINQDDPADVEKHLQVMDQVYCGSVYTVITLSTGLATSYQLNCLIELIMTRHTNRFPNSDIVLGALVALKRIVNDRWFSRTWAFQEKHCANWPLLLIPMDSSWDISYENVPEEYGVPQTLGNDLLVHLLPLYLVLVDEQFVRWQASSIVPEKPLEPDQDPCPQSLIDCFDAHNPATASQPLVHPNLGNFRTTYLQMENCSNLKAADRLSIYANSSSARFRILSNRLDRLCFSYNTCFLAFILPQIYLNRDDRQHIISKEWTELSQTNFKGFITGKVLAFRVAEESFRKGEIDLDKLA